MRFTLIIFLLVVNNTFSFSQDNKKLKKTICYWCEGKKVLVQKKICSNCINWNDEYRRKVPCHSCKDSRYVFSHYTKCSSCKGKGYEYKEELGDYFKNTDGQWDYFLGKSSSPLPTKKNNTNTEQNTPAKQNVLKNEPYKVAMPDKIVPCDENKYNWTIGCQNNKIKELNLRLLGREDNGVYTNDLMEALLSSAYMRGADSVITKAMYDKIMSRELKY